MKKNLLILQLLVIMAIPMIFASCSSSGDDKDNPPPPDNPSNPAVTEVIPTAGGSISCEDASVTFPSGTFSGAPEVDIKEEKSGDILGEAEESAFYTLTVPADFKEGFTISIKSDKKDEDTYLVFHEPVVATHATNNTVTYADVYIPATYSNGAYTATIDAADNAGVRENLSLSFGLAKSYVDKAQTGNRAGSTRSADDGTISWDISWGLWGLNPVNWTTITKLKTDINAAMEDAVKAIKDLGFKVKGDRKIPLNVTTPGRFSGLAVGEYGQHQQSSINDKRSTILLNRDELTGSDYQVDKLRRTIIHELFHYFQSAYDPSGTAWDKCSANDDDKRKRIMEAGGVWIEKLFDKEGMYDNGWADDFNHVLRGLLDKGIGNIGPGVNVDLSWGYGSAFVFDWFELKKGKKQIVKMYETWRDKKINDFKPWLMECEKACEVEFFSKFSDYITTIAEGHLNAGIDWTTQNPKAGRKKFTANNFEKDGAMEITLTKNSSDSRKSIVYHYGIKTCRIWITREQNDLDLKNQLLKISHNQKNIQAKVWLTEKNSGAVTYIGTVLAGKAMQITDEATLKALSDKRTQSDLVVVIEQISNERQQEAFEITASLEELGIETNPKSLAFEAKGGTKEVTVVTNQPNFKVKANNDWLEVKKEGNLTFKVTASANSGDARTGSVSVTALDDENKEVGTYEMKVTQEERGKGAYDFTDLKYVTIEVNSKVHYTGVWDGSQNDVFVVTKFPDNFNITEGYLEEFSDKPDVSAVGNGVKILCVCKTDENGENWMNTWTLSREYLVTIDINDVVSGKITNITVKCDWDYYSRAAESLGGNVEKSHNFESLTASNIPLPDKDGEAIGNQQTGTIINSLTRDEKRGWTDYKYTAISSDDYSIVVKFHK